MALRAEEVYGALTSYVEETMQGAGAIKGDRGEKGDKGDDGFSPVITETATANGYEITITDISGTNTVTLTNGEKGEKGDKGDTGESGADGQDGYSPSIAVKENTAERYTLEVTNKDGSFTTPNLRGGSGSGGGGGGMTAEVVGENLIFT